MVVLEMGLFPPPVGMNVFIVHSVARHVPQSTIYRGVTPFWEAMLADVVLLAAFPSIATVLPDWVMGTATR
ncbi:TRAP transporter large permease subunit [Tabrizicola sp. DMG-N-6]|uniref:TRAP transporter large permease subunit n=2 Tax=Szabonella alba TaxID=2804194 RepID=A0A8K0VB09_9RHOB|nr:TRAP transporter large permease subunit [Szabonella alba]MBL4918623.1 TRAP transporter large permease subunit [Szabonella alba]